MERKRKKYLFSGRVQGVGFRWKAQKIAESLGITGWVRNLWDERVEMEIQGTQEEMDKMLSLLYQQRFIWIEELEERELPLEKESGFRIR